MPLIKWIPGVFLASLLFLQLLPIASAQPQAPAQAPAQAPDLFTRRLNEDRAELTRIQALRLPDSRINLAVARLRTAMENANQGGTLPTAVLNETNRDLREYQDFLEIYEAMIAESIAARASEPRDYSVVIPRFCRTENTPNQRDDVLAVTQRERIPRIRNRMQAIANNTIGITGAPLEALQVILPSFLNLTVNLQRRCTNLIEERAFQLAATVTGALNAPAAPAPVATEGAGGMGRTAESAAEPREPAPAPAAPPARTLTLCENPTFRQAMGFSSAEVCRSRYRDGALAPTLESRDPIPRRGGVLRPQVLESPTAPKPEGTVERPGAPPGFGAGARGTRPQ